MGNGWTYIVLLSVFTKYTVAQTADQSVYFTSWKEPPVNSSYGEGIATTIVKENVQVGTSTGIKLQALGGTGIITYYISEQSSPQYFSIGGPGKDEIITSSPLDYEKAPNVTIRVIALDQGNTQKTGDILMTILIGDVNDNAPVFEKTLYNTSVSELAFIDDFVMRVIATDADGTSPNNLVSYFIEGGETSGSFAIDTPTGSILVTRQLSWSAKSMYELKVLAVDGGQDAYLFSATATVRIFVQKGDTFTSWKEPPISTGIGHGTATVKVKENCEFGTSTGIKLQALGGIGTIQYFITHQKEPRYFYIGGTDMDEIMVAEPVDFETETEVYLSIHARDSGQEAKAGRANMTILIEDVNDNAPEFERISYQQFILQGLPIGSSVLNVVAVDNDRTSPNNDVHYSILDSNDSDYFNISTDHGIIYIAKGLPRERTTYLLTLLAVDGGTDPAPLTGTTTVSVIINREHHSVVTHNWLNSAECPTLSFLTIFTNMVLTLVCLM